MKVKFLLTGILLFLMIVVNAQNNYFPKGSVLPGGSINFNSTKTESSPSNSQKQHSFSVYPSIGFAVRDNLFLGISAGFLYAKNTATQGIPNYYDSTKTHGYSYGVFVRKYMPIKGGLSVFLQGDLNGSNSRQKSYAGYSQNQYDSKNFAVNAFLTPGVSYGINSKFQVELGLNSIFGVGYSKQKITNSPFTPNFTESSSFGVNTSLSNFTSQLFIGFRLLLQKQYSKPFPVKST